MALVLCEVAAGLRPAEATVSVRNYAGRTEFFPADRSTLRPAGEKYLLPVRLLYQYDHRNAAFIELPNEADSGASRIWVQLGDIQPAEGDG